MCGICGIVAYQENVLQLQPWVERMNQKLIHRGPDDEGYFFDQNDDTAIALGHRRLSIIDLTGGHQPVYNEDHTIALVFNGEIYNFEELRNDLIRKGHQFETRSDSEVMVHLYEEEGVDMVTQLRGMFAFALWDQPRRRIFLARDRVGKKPLFYYHNQGYLAFASELQALTILPPIRKEINPDGLFQFFHLGYIRAPQTGFRDICKLEPGHYLIKTDTELEIKPYWRLKFEPKLNMNLEETIKELERLLTESVKLRMISDVPLGVFLSGGVDSSLVALYMARLSAVPVKTFSIGFAHEDYNELPFARQVASYIGSDHQEMVVEPHTAEILPLLVRHYGEPYADSSAIPTYYVSQITREKVTVALNGDGGDESFIGYDRYRAIALSEQLGCIPSFLWRLGAAMIPDSLDFKNRWRRMKRFCQVASRPISQRYLRWMALAEPAWMESFRGPGLDLTSPDVDYFSSFFDHHPNMHVVEKAQCCDIHSYLPFDLLVKVDIATMCHALEGRSPLLDHHILEFAAQLPMKIKFPHHQQKFLLKQLIRQIMPTYNTERRKYGFGIPLAQWLRKDLKSLLQEHLLSPRFQRRKLFADGFIPRIIREHIEGKQDHAFFLYALLVMEIWYQSYID